jgi:metallophosphoesterase superfamily enzyme
MHVLRDWLLTAERVAVHLPSRTAVVADLHLGYSEARRLRGEAVPDNELAEQMLPLRRALQRHGLRRLVVAGDLFEDHCCQDAIAQFRTWISQHAIEMVALVPGNHDVASSERSSLGTHTLRGNEVVLGDWSVVHGDGLLPDGPVVHGHEHPYLRWSPSNRTFRPRGRYDRIASYRIEGPCYLAGGNRLILPAFSNEAAGVNILSGRRWRNYRCYVAAEDRVLDVGEVATLRRRLSSAFRVRPKVD